MLRLAVPTPARIVDYHEERTTTKRGIPQASSGCLIRAGSFSPKKPAIRFVRQNRALRPASQDRSSDSRWSESGLRSPRPGFESRRARGESPVRAEWVRVCHRPLLPGAASDEVSLARVTPGASSRSPRFPRVIRTRTFFVVSTEQKDSYDPDIHEWSERADHRKAGRLR